jgi:hypothetical protein
MKVHNIELSNTIMDSENVARSTRDNVKRCLMYLLMRGKWEKNGKLTP